MAAASDDSGLRQQPPVIVRAVAACTAIVIAVLAIYAQGATAARFAGCPVFQPGDAYDKDISRAAVDPHSAQYIDSMIDAGNTFGFYASTGVEWINLATDRTSLRTVHPKVAWHAFATRYPWDAAFRIEPLSDAHAIVVHTGSCHLYELYSATFSGNVLSAYSGADWDMRKSYTALPPGTPSSMSSGLSLFAGMVKWEEYRSGAIRHALNWAPLVHTVAQYEYVWPASDTNGASYSGTSTYRLPWGAHLRLKASYDTRSWGPQARAVARAMKRYGIYLADVGNDKNALYFANALDGSDPWDRRDLEALDSLRLSDFDVLRLPKIQRTDGH